MRETVLDNNKKSIIVSELNDLYNKSPESFHAFMRDIVGSSLKYDMVFSYDCYDLERLNSTALIDEMKLAFDIARPMYDFMLEAHKRMMEEGLIKPEE